MRKNPKFKVSEIIALVGALILGIAYILAPEFISTNEILCLVAFAPIIILATVDLEKLRK